MVAVATFFRNKVGRGILLGAGVLATVALGPYAVLALITIILLGCGVELASLARSIYHTKRKGATAAIALQAILTTLGALALTYVVVRYGLWLTMIIVAAVYFENAGAQIFGKLFGRTPLSPRYSPNKTVEGAIWGWACGFFCALGFLALAFWQVEVTAPAVWWAIAWLVPPLAEVGDLIESRMKRLAGVKDSGDAARQGGRLVRLLSLSRLLGSHGGALDKTDSLWFVMVVATPMLIILA